MRWKPIEELEDLFEDIQHAHQIRTHGDFAADVYEENDNVVVTMQMAGIAPDKIDIEADDHHLRISGTREQQQENKDKQFYRKEIKRGFFERIVELPCEVIGDKASAEIHNGLLTIVIPKQLQKKSQKITVKKK